MTREFFANRYFSLTIYWRDQLVRLIELGPGRQTQFQGHGETSYSARVAEAMNCYQTGKKVVWKDPPLDWMLITSSFQKRVLKTLMKNVPFGRTTSYGRLAGLSGSPGAGRAVGQAMSRNPWPLIVPCHRVLTGKGAIGGFSSGTDMKEMLLHLENRNCQEFDLNTVANVPGND